MDARLGAARPASLGRSDALTGTLPLASHRATVAAMSTIYDDSLPQQSSRLRFALWSFAGLLLLIPAVAMQFTAQMNWGREDFLAAAVLIGGAGLGVELAVRLIKSRKAMLFAIAGVLAGLLLVWAELAVGIFS